MICRIPISLAPPLGADSNILLSTCKEGLERVKVTENGILRLENDDCSTAKRIGDFFFAMVMKRSKRKFLMCHAM